LQTQAGQPVAMLNRHSPDVISGDSQQAAAGQQHAETAHAHDQIIAVEVDVNSGAQRVHTVIFGHDPVRLHYCGGTSPTEI